MDLAAAAAGGSRPDGRRGRGRGTMVLLAARMQDGIDASVYVGGAGTASAPAFVPTLAPTLAPVLTSALAPALASFGRTDPALGPEAGQIVFRDDRIGAAGGRIGRGVRRLGPELAGVLIVGVGPRPRRRRGHGLHSNETKRNETKRARYVPNLFGCRHKIRGEGEFRCRRKIRGVAR